MSRPGGGHGMRGMHSGEKAKDMKGTFAKLGRYLGRYGILILLVIAFAIGSTIFSILGPNILGNATTEIFNGLASKIQGGAGINFSAIRKIVYTLIALMLQVHSAILFKDIS